MSLSHFIKAIYDAGPDVFDRYAVYYNETPRRYRGQNLYPLLGMSEHPFHPQGFGQHSEGALGPHNGKRITFGRLPPDCQKAVKRDLGVALNNPRLTKKEIMGGIPDAVAVEKVDNNTYAYITKNGDRVLRLYHTDIVVMTLEGLIILNSGGYLTVTTKDRMNQILRPQGYDLFQKNRTWYISDSSGKTVQFYDGISLPMARKNPGGMTLSQAKALRSGDYIHSLTKKNADGTPMRARVTSVKTWKRDPSSVEIHYKRGMYEYGTITERELDGFGIGYGS